MGVHVEQRAVESLLCPPFAPHQQDPRTPTLFAKAVASYQQGPSTPKLFALLDALMLQGAHAWVCIAIHTVVHRRDVVPLSRVDLANLESMHADAELLMLRRGQQPPELSELNDGLLSSEPGLWSAGAHRETTWQSQAMRLSRNPSHASTPSRSTGGLPRYRLGGASGANRPPPAQVAAEESAPQVLERALQRLPGMHAERAAALLGVRPMERAEAMARVLRCESTVWEARAAYRDSHLLYHRQRLALLLQAACRRGQAQLEARERRGALRARHVIARWRLREATLVFDAWWGEVERGRRVWERASSAAARLLQHAVARAFGAWEGARRARSEALRPPEPSPSPQH